MVVQTVATGRPVSRPTTPRPIVRVLLTARAHGYLDAVQSLPASPAPFGHQAHRYYQGYLLGITAAPR